MCVCVCVCMRVFVCMENLTRYSEITLIQREPSSSV